MLDNVYQQAGALTTHLHLPDALCCIRVHKDARVGLMNSSGNLLDGLNAADFVVAAARSGE